MKIAKHIKGGSSSFRLNGRMVIAGSGYIGPIPDHVLAKYPSRFEIIDDLGFPRITTDMKRGEALTRSSGTSDLTGVGGAGTVSSGQSSPPKPEKYGAQHRGGGRWAVVRLATGEVVPLEMLQGKEDKFMPRPEAEAEASRLNSL